jgi:hypothetical protein
MLELILKLTGIYYLMEIFTIMDIDKVTKARVEEMNRKYLERQKQGTNSYSTLKKD